MPTRRGRNQLDAASGLMPRRLKTKPKRAVVEAMRMFNLKEGTILTQYQEDTLAEADGLVIHVVPLWKWLLGKE